MSICVLYSPFGSVLPSDTVREITLDFITTLRDAEGNLQTYIVRPGINLFPDTLPPPIMEWLKKLKETTPNVSIIKTSAKTQRATEFPPKLAVVIINRLFGGIEVFVEGCTDPVVLKAAKKRTEQLKMVYGN